MIYHKEVLTQEVLAIQSLKYHPEYYKLEESIEKQVCVFLSAHGRDFSCFFS